MTKEVILTFIRQIANSLFSAVAATGIINDNDAQALGGGLVVLISVVWGLFAKAKDQKEING